jgi:hypothetical protein
VHYFGRFLSAICAAGYVYYLFSLCNPVGGMGVRMLRVVWRGREDVRNSASVEVGGYISKVTYAGAIIVTTGEAGRRGVYRMPSIRYAHLWT